ncbi:hypothetical protein OPKNFCMD_6010 [Methylobacterium crusticola]|uniref:Uncharacterized protein n=1 Tax=Methylobacterium crusticola TaxID=1697972 RepID=A0ABQ4R6G4_9HYPH|nr:hypothetical protein [Methylobacterium crusticola]GJD53238.1 hypothetical protein OPKNFCMD_6010 [Methylobacterium crusticola]
MTWLGNRNALKYTGSMRGRGQLSVDGGARSLGPVSYEVETYVGRAAHRNSGQIEGDARALMHAFEAGSARIDRADQPPIDVVLSDPQGLPTAEISLV